MRKGLMLAIMAGVVATGAFASPREMTSKTLLRQRQKQELKALKLKEKFEKQTFKNQELPKAVREQMKHQMKREGRRLKNRQKDERQELKDQQRILKESNKQFGSD